MLSNIALAKRNDVNLNPYPNLTLTCFLARFPPFPTFLSFGHVLDIRLLFLASIARTTGMIISV